jgi:tetratricopeptide (TPR) repeat protein
MPKARADKAKRKQVLVVSAGDLEPERKALPGIAGRFDAAAEDNKIAVTQHYSDEPSDRTLSPGSFDLVIFLLWRHWGRPSGRYSSEFKRVYTEVKKAGIDCLFYFRAIPDSDMIAPDRDISRIITFRDEIEKNPAHSYFWYDDPAAWKKIVVNHLDKWIDGKVPNHRVIADMSDHKKRLAGLIRTLRKATDKGNLRAFRLALKAHSMAEKNRITRACQLFARATAAAREPYLINEYGIFLKKNGLWSSAERVFEDLARIGQLMEDKLVIGSAMRHLGDVNRRADNPVRADKYLQRAAAAERGLGRTLKEAVIHQERGILHLKLGHLDMAEKLLSDALRRYKEAGSIEGQAIVYFSLTGVYIEKADVVAAAHTSQKALELFQRIGADDMIDKLQVLLVALENMRDNK